MDYYLGLDAGGTKTYCLVGDAQGNVLGFGRAGTGSYEYHGIEPAMTENRKAIDGALRAANLTLNDIAAVGMGVAGADLPEDYAMLEEEIYTPLFGNTRRVFRNDSFAGLRGGLREPYGIVIACGTHIVCAGQNRQGDEARVGGISPEFGDMTSGPIIGQEGLHMVWRARDGVEPPTQLTEKFLKKSGCADVDEMFTRMYRQELTLDTLQPIAKIVFEAAVEGDSAACDILERHGRYLGKMANACARQLGMAGESFSVVMTGSVFKGQSPVLRDAMTTVVHREFPLASIVRAAFEPVVGALLMAMEVDKPVSDAVYDHLAESTREAEKRYGVSFRAE